MTVEQIVQTIYEERYEEPTDPELKGCLQRMILEIVERALALSSSMMDCKECLGEGTVATTCCKCGAYQ